MPCLSPKMALQDSLDGWRSGWWFSERQERWRVKFGLSIAAVVTYLDGHLLLCESFDVSNSTWSSFLELNALKPLVHVERVVAARNLHLCLLDHLTTNIY